MASELERATQRLADKVRTKESTRVMQARLEEEERRKVEQDYQEHVRPALLSAQKTYLNDNVPRRVLILLDEVAREIEARERGILKGMKSKREVTFVYPANPKRIVTENGECDKKESFVQDWRSGNLEKSVTPQSVEIEYKDILRDDGDYSEGFDVALSIDATNIRWSGRRRSSKYSSKSDEDIDRLAEDFVNVLNSRAYYYRYEKTRSERDEWGW